MFEHLATTFKGFQEGLVAGQEIAAVPGFERSEVVFDHTGQPHDFERMRAQSSLMMIAQGDEEEQSGQKGDDHNANGGARQQLEMEMLGTKKPGETSPVNPSANRCG